MVNNMKKHAKEIFFNNLELTLMENFDTNRRGFWKLTWYFVKNSYSTSVPPLCTVTDNNKTLLHSTVKDKAECLNDYFTSIPTVCDDNAELSNFHRLTENSFNYFGIAENEVKDRLSQC